MALISGNESQNKVSGMKLEELVEEWVDRMLGWDRGPETETRVFGNWRVIEVASWGRRGGGGR